MMHSGLFQPSTTVSHSPSIISSQRAQLSLSHPIPDMSDQSGSPHLRALFEAALQEYETQTGISLAKHPLVERLHSCDSVDSITTLLLNQTLFLAEFRGEVKFLKLLKSAVSVLYKLSATADFRRKVSLNFQPVKALYTGIAVLLSVTAVKGSTDTYDALVDFLESIEHVLSRLDVYTKIPPTISMTEMVVKILAELLCVLALATKRIEQGELKEIAKKLLEEKDVEAVLQRLDRLTLDEFRVTAALTLEVISDLFHSMRVVMEDSVDGKTLTDRLRDTLEIMQQVASDKNRIKRDELEQKLRGWLSPPDPWANHNIACELRHRGSVAWFVQSNTFSDWKASEGRGSVLWVHGKPGAGKSVFCSAIIQDIHSMQKAGLASLAFFYFDFREEQKKNLRGLISSLLVQLCHQSDTYFDMLFEFYSEHEHGKRLRHPSDDTLVGCLKDLLKLPGLAPVYIIMDALDECSNTSSNSSPRAKVLDLIEELIKSQSPNLSICVTSRLEGDIKDVLDPLIPHYVSLHNESGQKNDIVNYIQSVINTNPKSERWKAEDKQLAIDFLTENADGMFRWVDCQADYICGLDPARIQHALAEFPETLDETYQHALRRINEADWEFAHRLFQFVAVASRPLRVKELAELLAFDFKTGPIPEFHEGWLLEDPVHAVLSACSSLLVTFDGGYPFEKVIKFSHFSVREFLTSARLSEASDIILRRHHVSMTSAHTLVAQACLGVLLHLDKDAVTEDRPENWPLAQYTAEHWAHHVRFEGVPQNVEDGVKQLFDPRKRHFAVCICILDPDFPPLAPNQPAFPLRGTPLHYAGLWDLHFIVKFLIIERSQDVNSRCFTDDATPLHLASKCGHLKTVSTLMEYGADVKARNSSGETSLHLALFWGQVEVSRMLIECGADVTTQNEDRETPLHLASLRGQVEVARMIIERNGDVIAKNKDGETPLHLASWIGQQEIAHLLTERGADVRAQNEAGETPLHLASLNGHLEVTRTLIERDADVSAQNKYGETPLHLALREGQVDVAGILIEGGADVKAKDQDGLTSLHLASLDGQDEVASILIERGADLTAQNKIGETPLHLASRKGQLEVAGMLIERGADVTAQNEYGSTPLHIALQSGQVEVTRMLIEHGASVTAQNKNGETPLHLVSLGGQTEVVEMLIERGADVTAQNKEGETPLHLASFWGQMEVAHIFIKRSAKMITQNKRGETPLHLALREGQVELARMLIEHGADLISPNNNGKTPLHLVLQEGQTEVARTLIEYYADVSPQNKNKETLLHLASFRGQVEVARMLIECGADVTAKNMDGSTPLHLASLGGHVEVVRMLLMLGADVSAQNKYGETPLHPALRGGQVEVASILIGCGTDVTVRNKNGSTPLHLASFWDQVEVVNMLIERGADVTAQSEDGTTPLHLASLSGHVEVTFILIDSCADVSARNKYFGETPLHLALQRGQLEVARMLIDHGADATARNVYGEAPEERHYHERVVQNT